MKIAYLGQMAEVSGPGSIAKKIRAQTREWLQQGHEVRYFAQTPTTACWSGLVDLQPTLIPRRPAWRRLQLAHALCDAIRAWGPDVIYFRFAHHAPGLPRLFAEIPAIAEINSDDRREYPLTLSWPKQVYHRITRDWTFGAVAGFVTVTRELEQRLPPDKRPRLAIGNSIRLADHPILPPPPADSPPRLAFLGTAESVWHGLERIGELATLLPEVSIDLVGTPAADWSRVTGTPQPPANLMLHGPMDRDTYAPLLAQATAALGSMALYKNHLSEACPLKTREYLAVGLPVIAAYRDTDVPAGADYFLELPNSPESLAPQVAAIRTFLERWRQARVPREAVQHLDTSAKETERLTFIRRFLA